MLRIPFGAGDCGVSLTASPRWRQSERLPGPDQGFLHIPARSRAPVDGRVPVLQPGDGEFGTHRPRSPLWPGLRAHLGGRLWDGLRRWRLGGLLQVATGLGRQLRPTADPPSDRGLPAFALRNQRWGWFLVLASVAALAAGVLQTLIMRSQPTTLWNVLTMMALIGSGGGLMFRSLKGYVDGQERKTVEGLIAELGGPALSVGEPPQVKPPGGQARFTAAASPGLGAAATGLNSKGVRRKGFCVLGQSCCVVSSVLASASCRDSSRFCVSL